MMRAMSDLTLYAEAEWISPWVFHAMVALEEKGLAYQLRVLELPRPPAEKQELQRKAVIGKVPILVHRDAWISESLAISEYLAEAFPTPAHPRIFPEDLVKRARARQVMLFLRTDLFALREDRPTTSVFGPPTSTPLSAAGGAQAAELLRIAGHLVLPGRDAMFGAFSIADADLALALMRLIRNHDPVPDHLVAYAEGIWVRPSVQRFVSHHATMTGPSDA
jgi:glutathione S-transferase